MKNNFTISVPKPCAEKWDDFTPATKGGFCNSCNKTVVDFTNMDDEEILAFFSKRPTHSCGRFRPDQLRAYSDQARLKFIPGLTLLKAGFLSLLFILMNKQSSAQNTAPKTKTEVVDQPNHRTNEKRTNDDEQILRGIIVSREGGDALPGASIYLKGSTTGTSADAQGRFEFPQKVKQGDVIVVSFIGFESKEYTVPGKTTGTLEIRMACSYDVMGEVAVNSLYSTHQPKFSKFWSKAKKLF